MSLPILRMPWEIRQNEPFLPSFTYVDENGEPISIVGHTITAVIRTARAFDGGSLVATLTVDFTDAAEGRYRCSLTSVQTAALTAAVFAGWGQVWITGPSTDNEPKQLVEANPVSVI